MNIAFVGRIAAVLLLAGCADAGADRPELAQAPALSGAEAGLAAVADDQNARYAYFKRFPKGGDLHNHLSGAIYPETWIQWAVDDGLCIDLSIPALVYTAPEETGCNADKGFPAARDALPGGPNAEVYNALVDSLSVRNQDIETVSGHQNFFRTFFRIASNRGRGWQLARVAMRNAEQNVLYLELSMSFCRSEAARAAGDGPVPNEWSAFRSTLLADIADCPQAYAARMDEAEAEARRLMGCDGESPHAGCDVEIRYIAGVNRTFSPRSVLAQLIGAAEVIAQDPRVVGLTLLAPEDHPLSMRHYSDHMRMTAFAMEQAGASGVALHAGELVMGLVPPDDLRFHIREAVEVAGSSRIGHGTGIAYENDAADLVRQMAQAGVAVEMNLTSNHKILGVEPQDYPFDFYRSGGVPILISTDDEGILRTDLSQEYSLTAHAFGLDYEEMKDLSRNSIAFSFLAGEAFWQDPGQYSVVHSDCAASFAAKRPADAQCLALLQRSDKARLQYLLERRFVAFEERF